MHAQGSGRALKIVMIIGSVRQGRMADRVAKCMLKSVEKYTKSLSITTLDPVQVVPKCELNRQPLHFLSKTEPVPEWMQNVSNTITKADGFLILSTEYNGFMPPALLDLMNTFPPSMFRHKPVGLVTYAMGTTGGMRALNAVRPYVSELGMLTIPGYVPIPTVHDLIDEEGNCQNELVNKNIGKLLGNLEWYSQAIRNYLESSGSKPVDEHE